MMDWALGIGKGIKDGQGARRRVWEEIRGKCRQNDRPGAEGDLKGKLSSRGTP